MPEQTITPAATETLLPSTYVVRDNNGDFHTITVQTCARCKRQIDPRVGSHPICVKEAEQERKIQERKIQHEEDLKIFGEVIYDDRERYMRLNPDARDTYTNKSWNMMLAEKEWQEKRRNDRSV